MLIGALCAFGSSFTWAYGVTVYTVLGKKYVPCAISATRALIAFILFSIILCFTPDPVFPNSEQAAWLVLSMISSYAVGDFLFLLASQRIGVPSALAIACVYPIFSSAMGWMFRGEMLTLRNSLGVLLVVCGTIWVILSVKKEASVLGLRSFRTGVLFALGTSVCWAMNTYSVAKGSVGLTPQAANWVRMSCAIFLCPLAGWLMGAFKGRPFLWILPKAEIKKHGWVFAMESCGGSILYVMGLTLAPLGVAAALSSLSPVIAAPVAWVRGTEKISIRKFSALLMVVVGIVLLTV